MSGYDIPDPPTPDEVAEAETGTTEEEPQFAPEDVERLNKQRILGEIGVPVTAITAFVVILNEDGVWLANSNLVGTEMETLPNGQRRVKKLGKLPPIDAIEVRREASLNDMGNATSALAANISTILGSQMAAGQVVGQMQAMAMRAQQQAEAQAMFDRLGKNGGIAGPDGRPIGR